LVVIAVIGPLVRDRAAQVLRSSPALIATYDDDLRHLADMDVNPSVREVATLALRRSRG
jgi:hypothetical protein